MRRSESGKEPKDADNRFARNLAVVVERALNERLDPYLIAKILLEQADKLL